MNSVDVCAVAAIVVIVFVVVELILKVKHNGVKAVVADFVDDDLKEFVIDMIGDALINVGLTKDYDDFKAQIELYMVGKIRESSDDIGGTFDAIADEAVTDEQLCAIIDKIIVESGADEDIRKAYDKLVSDRIHELEASEEAEAKRNEELETEDLAKYDTVENEAEPEVSIDAEE